METKEQCVKSDYNKDLFQPASTCSKLRIEKLEQGVKNGQS